MTVSWITRDGETDHCASCDAPIIWLTHETTGRCAPINAESRIIVGNIVVNRQAGTYRVLNAQQRQEAQEAHTPLYTNHFMSCPKAHAWHKSGPTPKRRKEPPTHAE